MISEISGSRLGFLSGSGSRTLPKMKLFCTFVYFQRLFPSKVRMKKKIRSGCSKSRILILIFIIFIRNTAVNTESVHGHDLISSRSLEIWQFIEKGY